MRTLSLLLLSPLLATTAFAAPAAKVDVCHVGDSGTQLIRVAASAWPAHAAHGDTRPGQFYVDADGDGHGSGSLTSTTASCTAPAGYTTSHDDCDDTSASVYPGAPEVCDGLDQDCDGQIDDGAPGATWYADFDADGYGDASYPQDACTQPAGTVADDSDCDDGDAAINPGAAETCSPADDDCDGLVNESDALDAGTWYADLDADGYGDPDDFLEACGAPAGYVATASDCDDGDAAVNPSADEVCDGIDDDCDGTIDTDAIDAPSWFADADGDGYGDGGASLAACEAPAGYLGDNTDCDDGDDGVNPGAAEVCAGGDENCNGQSNEPSAVDAPTWYGDADGDGYGVPGDAAVACSAPDGYAPASTDCDDTAADTHPGVLETCDGNDENCDGEVDNGGDCSYHELSWSSTSGWFDAEATCESRGMHLVVFDDMGELDAVLALIATSPDAPRHWWIGAFRPSSETLLRQDPTYVADDWAWINDAPFAYTAWAPYEPENLDGLDCASLDAVQGAWNDRDCEDAEVTGWICEADGTTAADADGDGYTWAEGDCDLEAAGISPSTAEVCDGLDDDCDGLVDEDYPGSVGTHYYYDGDGDGYGLFEVSWHTCDAQPANTAPLYGDCDDTDGTRSPGTPETCNGLDDDCDGLIDEGAFFADADGDGHGDAGSPMSCSGSGGGIADDSDCDDAAADVHPGAADACGDGVDSDCGGEPDACACPCFDTDDLDALYTLPGAVMTVSLRNAAPAAGEEEYLDLGPDGAIRRFGLSAGAGLACDVSLDPYGTPSTLTHASVSADEYAACEDTLRTWLDDQSQCGGDADADGFTSCYMDYETVDCDDTNTYVYPGAEDTCGDALDQDCDGVAEECADCPCYDEDTIGDAALPLLSAGTLTVNASIGTGAPYHGLHEFLQLGANWSPETEYALFSEDNDGDGLRSFCAVSPRAIGGVTPVNVIEVTSSQYSACRQVLEQVYTTYAP